MENKIECDILNYNKYVRFHITTGIHILISTKNKNKLKFIIFTHYIRIFGNILES